MANPNPSPETRFGAGEKANPQGKTSAQRKAEIANAEAATRLRARLLKALEAETEEGAGLQHIETAILKLLKDTEDRGLGTPVQTVDNTSSDGSMTPTAFTFQGVAPDDNGDDPATAKDS